MGVRLLSCWRLTSGCVLTLSCLALAGGAVVSAQEKTTEPRLGPLPGRAVGVLVGDVRAAMAAAGRSGPEDAVGYFSGKGSFRWLYVPCSTDSPDSQSLRLRVGKDGKAFKRFESVELLRRPLLKERRLTPDFQLVEVEVNDGAGSPGTECIVASRIKALDGTKEYPLRVSPTVARLKKEFATLLRVKEKAIQAVMAEQQKKALGEKKPTGPRQRSEEVRVTWLPDSEVLQVEFSQRITDGLYSRGKGIDTLPAQRPVTKAKRFGLTFGVETRATYQVTKTGEVREPAVRLSPIRSAVPPPSKGRLLAPPHQKGH